MATERPFLRRLTLAGLGMFLLGVVGYVGLGLVVWEKAQWVERYLGMEWRIRLQIGYAKAFAAVLPGDRDGDGARDGLEIFLHSDPAAPAARPYLRLTPSVDFVHAVDDHIDRRLWRQELDGWAPRFVPVGETITVRGRVGFFADTGTPLGGWQAKITAPPHYRLRTSGVPWTDGSLILPMADDGVLCFDLQAMPEAVTHPFGEMNLLMDRVDTGETFHQQRVDAVWAGPPLVITAARVPLVRPVPNDTRYLGRPEAQWEVHWAGVPATVKWLYLEAAADRAGATWYPIGRYPPEETSITIIQYRLRWMPSYNGPLKFRVVPIYSQAPPP